MANESLPAPAAWPALDLAERRVLGVLVEKAKTTPDAYPLSLNSLVTGCNQKSNREPVLNLSEVDVEDALGRCQKQGLAARITGGRVERWRHLLYEAWHVDKVDLAILAELLLRGPQTEGELRPRAARMEPIEDLDALRRCLRPLVERKLVVYLTAEDRRGAVLTHGFHSPAELARLKSQEASQPAPAVVPPAAVAVQSHAAVAVQTHTPSVPAGQDEARAEIAALTKKVADLEETLSAVREEVRALKVSLGA